MVHKTTTTLCVLISDNSDVKSCMLHIQVENNRMVSLTGYRLYKVRKLNICIMTIRNICSVPTLYFLYCVLLFLLFQSMS